MDARCDGDADGVRQVDAAQLMSSCIQMTPDAGGAQA